MLAFGKEQARRLIGGAAWAYKEYISDYRTNPEVKIRLAGFASNHGQPEERFYNLMCMAYGADPVTFADVTEVGFLPPNRSPTCKIEFEKLKHAFHKAVWPHVDHKMAMQVMDMWWLPEPDPSLAPTAQK
jgi:Putative metallopeptidase